MSESAIELMEKSLPQSESDVSAKESKTMAKEPIKSEDNVLSQEEIMSLEKKENHIKGGIFGKIFKNNHASAPNRLEETNTRSQDTDNSPETDIHRLEKDLGTASSRIESVSMSVEKIEGKIESERAVASGIEERISRLTEEIGELRSMILDRERGFNEIETNFKKIEAMTEEIKPQNIKKDLDRKEREIIDITVKIERLEAVSSETNKQIKLFREQMNKIRSLDNLLKVSKDIEENIGKIKETEKYTDRMAAKTEELFTELDKRLAQFVSHTARIESLDELTRDLMKSQDKNEIKLKEAVFKEDLEKLKNSVVSSVNDNIKKEISGDNSSIGKKLEEACKSAAEAKETVSKMSADEKNKDIELTNIKAILKSFDSQLKDLKSQSEIQNIETQKKIEYISTGTSSADRTPTDSINKNQDLPEIFNMISEKKIKEVRKEIEDISDSMRCLSSSISDLKKNNLSQMNNIMDLKIYQDNLPSAIETKIIEKTSDIKTNIAMMTDLLAQFQKNKNTEKQDIDNIRQSLSNIEKGDKLRFTLIEERNTSKNNDLELIRKEISALDNNTRKEIELARKDDEISRAEIEKTLKKEIARLENSNKDITQISDTVRDLEDNISYMKDSIDSTQLENDNIKTAIDAKIIKSVDDLKKELDEFRAEKDESMQELEKGTSKTEELNKKIIEVLEYVTDLKDNLRYMRESIDSSQTENDNLKSAIETKIRENTDELKKELAEIDSVKKEIESMRAAKDSTKKERDIDSPNMDQLAKKIHKISISLAQMKDNMDYMKDSIDSTQLENDGIKTAIDTKIIRSKYELKRDLDAAISEKNVSHELEKESPKIEELNRKIREISSTVTGLKDKAEKNEDRIDHGLKENKITKSAVNAEISDDAKIYDARKNMSVEYRKTRKYTEMSELDNSKKEIQKNEILEKKQPSEKYMPEAALLERIQKDMRASTENHIADNHNQLAEFGIPENIAEDTLQPDEYDLRLNKIIRLINKTEEYLKKNNHEDARQSYENLKTAYNTIYRKVPKNQADEIRPKIDRLQNLLEKSNRF